MPSHKDKPTIFIYSNDINLLDLWEKNLVDHSCKSFEDEESLIELRDSFIILNTRSSANLLGLVKVLVKQNNQILLLDNIVNLQQGQSYLENGIMGYGNERMSSLFLNTAIASILEGFIWLHPKVTQEIIGTLNISNTSQKTETSLDLLTKREQEIALELITQKSYDEISKELSISINTLKTHAKNIYKKLSLNDRLSLTLLLK